MKAVVYERYGPPDVLRPQDVETPVPKASEILVRIRATTVTSGDVRLRSSSFPPLLWPAARMMFGLRGPRNGILGHELAGEVESIGSSVTRFRVGDQVFGSTGFRSGTYAEYISLAEEGTVAAKPAGITFEEAAAIPVGGLTALHFLRKSKILAGQRILIFGASGSVGTYAVQIAKSLGADVTGVCSTKNMELVASLGADRVVDYTNPHQEESAARYDAVFDAVGKSPRSAYRNSLSPNGRHVTVSLGTAKERAEDLVYLGTLAGQGKLRAVIDRTYRFEQIAEAHRYVEQGHKKGNVVITLNQGGAAWQ